MGAMGCPHEVNFVGCTVIPIISKLQAAEQGEVSPALAFRQGQGTMLPNKAPHHPHDENLICNTRDLMADTHAKGGQAINPRVGAFKFFSIAIGLEEYGYGCDQDKKRA